jgi:hypothetical protein
MLYRDPERIMGELIPSAGRPAWDYFQAKKFDNWRDEAGPLGKVWKEAVSMLAARWGELSEQQRFSVLQQVGSILRTSMVNDLESRLP